MTATLIVISGMLFGFGIMNLIKRWFNSSLPVMPEPEPDFEISQEEIDWIISRLFGLSHD